MSGILDKEELNLDLTKNEYKYIECKQFDNLILHFIIENQGTYVNLDDYNLQFNIRRPDTTFIIQSNNITKNANGEVTVVCRPETTNVYGEIRCELVLINNLKKQKSTFDVIIDARKSVLHDMQSIEPITITIIETLQNTINVANDTDIKLNTSIENGNTINDKLTSNITKATDINTTLNTVITTANTTKSNLNTAINNGTAKVTEIQNTGDTVLKNMDDINASSTDLKDAITAQNESFKNNINDMNDLLNSVYKLSPLPSEVYHTLMNLMGMALFTERELGKKYTGAYTNMFIMSFMNTDELTLENAVYDSENHQVLFGSGYINGIAFCYE